MVPCVTLLWWLLEYLLRSARIPSPQMLLLFTPLLVREAICMRGHHWLAARYAQGGCL